MPISFTPDLIPRYESGFLNYVNQSMLRLKEALKDAPLETIQETDPVSPYQGQTWYKPSEQTVYIYTGSDWAELYYHGSKDSLMVSPGATAPNVTLALMPWTTAGSLDTNLMTYSGGTFTVVKAGHYTINACIVYGTGGTGTRNCYIMHNGNYVARQGAPPDAVSPGATCSYSQYLAAGATVSAWYYQDSGGNLALVGGSSASYFGFVRTNG